MHITDAIGLVLIALSAALSFYAQMKVSSTFKKYSTVANRKGHDGADVARQILLLSGITDVNVERVPGNLTDHYDPTSKTLRLSDSVYASTSIAALGVAAHEAGHAIQHAKSYAPLNMRSSIFPVVNFSSKMSTPLIFAGILFSSFGGSIGMMILYTGIILFIAVVAFQVVTLPVEFDASARAIRMLQDNNFLTTDEIQPARKVLNAAALTYVAAAIVAIAQLIRLILIVLTNRGRD